MKYLSLVLCALTFPAVAQETCGLELAKYEQPDSIFRNGFDNVTLPLAESAMPKTSQAKGTGLGPPITTVMPPALGVTPTITITSPSPGASLVGTVQIQGTFTGPTNTGISVAGYPAFVFGNRFLSRSIRMDLGVNNVIVRAKTMDGLSAQASVSIAIATPASQTPQLNVAPKTGFKPLSVESQIANISNLTITSLNADFDGDGNLDYSGSMAGLPKWTYQVAGIFQSTVTLNTTSGPVVLRALIFVEDPIAIQTKACVPYAHLRSRLRANDINGALQALTKNFGYQFKPSLLSLGANLPVFASRIGTIANGVLSTTQAELILVEPVNGGIFGAPMLVMQSADGVWRIDSF